MKGFWRIAFGVVVLGVHVAVLGLAGMGVWFWLSTSPDARASRDIFRKTFSEVSPQTWEMPREDAMRLLVLEMRLRDAMLKLDKFLRGRER